MSLSITDPAIWPAGFAPLQFVPCPVHSAECAFVVRTARGDEIAELVLLDHEDGNLMLDENQAAVVPLAGAWALTLIDSQGRVTGDHVLCTIDQRAGHTTRPSGLVFAWATATLLWMVVVGDRGHG